MIWIFVFCSFIFLSFIQESVAQARAYAYPYYGDFSFQRQSPIYTMKRVGDRIFAGTERGLFIIEKDQIRKIINDPVDIVNKDYLICSHNKSKKVWKFNSDIPLQLAYNNYPKINSVANHLGITWLATSKGLFELLLEDRKNNNQQPYLSPKDRAEAQKKAQSFNGNRIFKSLNVNAILSTDNLLWIGASNGLHLMQGANENNIKHLIKNKNITAFTIYQEHVWIGSDKGELWKVPKNNPPNKLNDKHKVRSDALKDHSIHQLEFDPKGRCWIAAGHQIFRFDFEPKTSKDNVPYVYDQQLGFNCQSNTSFAIDQDNVVWIGTEGNGIYSIDPALRIHLDYNKSLTCHGDLDTLKLRLEGGEKPYTYSFNKTRFTDSIPVSTDTDSLSFELGGGVYKLTVRDAIGDERTANIVIKQPQPFNVKIRHIEYVKKKEKHYVFAKINGGVEPPKYLWSNGDTERTISSLKADGSIWSVSVTDRTGCKASNHFIYKDSLTLGDAIVGYSLLFDMDSTKIKTEIIPILESVASFMIENPKWKFEVQGHTNLLPSKKYALDLSTSRAQAIHQFLIQKGVPQKQITYKGYGKSKPIHFDENNDPKKRTENQRVAFKLLAKD